MPVEKKFFWYPRDVHAYRRDTGGLSLAHHGAYTLLMDEYYITGRPLPADNDTLFRICHCHNDVERAVVQEVLARYFTLSGVIYTQGRIERELERRKKVSTARKGAALGRWSKRAAAKAP